MFFNQADRCALNLRRTVVERLGGHCERGVALLWLENAGLLFHHASSAIICSMALTNRGSGSSHTQTLALRDEFGSEECTFGTDAINRHFQFLCIGVKRTLDLVAEITVYSVPVVGMLRELVLLPLRNIPFNELKPHFFIFFSEVGGCELHGVLQI